MMQLAAERTKGIASSIPLIVCNAEHRFIVAEQLRQMNMLKKNVMLEPKGRNTAPAIALAALHVLTTDKDALILVLAADHLIKNVANFHKAVTQGAEYAKNGKLVTFGITPIAAETGYGYIHKGSNISEATFNIARFVEKPDVQTANKYFESKEYLWNSGMFLFSAKKYIDEMEKFNPDMLSACVTAYNGAENSDDFIHINESYANCPADSIDYAVMEKTSDGIVVEMDAQWNDVGSWSSLWDISDKDANGNHVQGDVICHGSKDSYIKSESALIAVVNVDGLIVVQTKDAVLVASKDSVQDVKKVVERLKEDNRDEYRLHREVYRPWGKYDSIDVGHRYKVKCITVNPGEKLSVQKHFHRAEHWIVVQGTATVTKDEEVRNVYENESIYLPMGSVHALENPGKLPLILIEVQSGAYLGEDDIVRFEDKYGR
jgi:mannose-1-phosphate guanylyltransferase